MLNARAIFRHTCASCSSILRCTFGSWLCSSCADELAIEFRAPVVLDSAVLDTESLLSGVRERPFAPSDGNLGRGGGGLETMRNDLE